MFHCHSVWSQYSPSPYQEWEKQWCMLLAVVQISKRYSNTYCSDRHTCSWTSKRGRKRSSRHFCCKSSFGMRCPSRRRWSALLCCSSAFCRALSSSSFLRFSSSAAAFLCFSFSSFSFTSWSIFLIRSTCDGSIHKNENVVQRFIIHLIKQVLDRAHILGTLWLRVATWRLFSS